MKCQNMGVTIMAMARWRICNEQSGWYPRAAYTVPATRSRFYADVGAGGSRSTATASGGRHFMGLAHTTRGRNTDNLVLNGMKFTPTRRHSECTRRNHTADQAERRRQPLRDMDSVCAARHGRSAVGNDAPRTWRPPSAVRCGGTCLVSIKSTSSSQPAGGGSGSKCDCRYGCTWTLTAIRDYHDHFGSRALAGTVNYSVAATAARLLAVAHDDCRTTFTLTRRNRWRRR